MATILPLAPKLPFPSHHKYRETRLRSPIRRRSLAKDEEALWDTTFTVVVPAVETTAKKCTANIGLGCGSLICLVAVACWAFTHWVKTLAVEIMESSSSTPSNVDQEEKKMLEVEAIEKKMLEIEAIGEENFGLSEKALEELSQHPAVLEMIASRFPKVMRNPATIKWVMRNQRLDGLLRDIVKDPDTKKFSDIELTEKEVIEKVFGNPVIAKAFRKRRIQVAVMNVTKHSMSVARYQHDEEVMEVFNMIANVFSGTKKSPHDVVSAQLPPSQQVEAPVVMVMRNLLWIAIFNISYIRGLFPEKYFNDEPVPALEMKIKKLIPVDEESRRLIDWMEKGVYDALRKKYLKTLLFCVCEDVEGPMIEEYTFSFSYSNSDSQEVSINSNWSGNKKQGGTFKFNSTTEITPKQMRSSACRMVRTLVQLMRTLDRMPEERTLLMKLQYYDDVTPADYEPPFFRGCTEEETRNLWTKKPLQMEVGNVNSKHLVLALKVKSVLDPCEDKNDDIQDDAVSLGADSIQREYSSESDSEVNQSYADQHIVAPAASDDTQDLEEDEHKCSQIKDWISSCQLDTVEVTDVLLKFPDISVVLIKETIDKLVLDGTLAKTGGDSYAINRMKKFDYELAVVKQEINDQAILIGDKTPNSNDHLYMKALCYVLPMQYVSVPKLQNKLGREANHNTVRKMIDKMAQEGFVEAKGNGRLGKRVIHSDVTEKKLIEVQKALNYAMDVDNVEPPSKSNHQEIHPMGSNQRDTSTCCVLHSIGSDLTRTRVRPNSQAYSPTRSEQTTSKTKGQGNTTRSRAQPIVLSESFAPGYDQTRANGANHCDDGDRVNSSTSTQGKRSRKTSTVKEPILQYTKRQRSHAV